MDGSSFICNHPCIATSSVRLGSTLCIHPFTSEYPRTPVTQFPDHDDLYCKFSFTHGPDWTVVSVCFSGDGNPPNIASNSLHLHGDRHSPLPHQRHSRNHPPPLIQGAEDGITQQSVKFSTLTPLTQRLSSAPANAWNFPLDIAFRSTNAFGWPKLTLAVYGPDWFGRDVVRGYGWAHLPMTPGK